MVARDGRPRDSVSSDGRKSVLTKQRAGSSARTEKERERTDASVRSVSGHKYSWNEVNCSGSTASNRRARSRRNYERCAINGFEALHISIMRGILGQRLRNASSPRAPTLRGAIPQCHLSLSLSLPSSFDSLEIPTTYSPFPSLRFARWPRLLSVAPVLFHLPGSTSLVRCTRTFSRCPPPPPLVAIVRQCSLVSRCFRPTYPNIPFSLSLSLFSSLLPFLTSFSRFTTIHSHSLSLSLSWPLCQPSAAPLHCPHIFPPLLLSAIRMYPMSLSFRLAFFLLFLLPSSLFIDAAPYARKLFRAVRFVPPFSSSIEPRASSTHNRGRKFSRLPVRRRRRIQSSFASTKNRIFVIDGFLNDSFSLSI